LVHETGFALRGISYSNGSNVLLNDIGEGENALFCTTTQTECCGVDENGIINGNDLKGEFNYPNGTAVPVENQCWW